MIRLSILLFAVCTLLSSCAVSYDIQFNDDLSGHVGLTIGPSPALPVPAGQTPASVPPERIAQRTEELSNIEGISDPSIEVVDDNWVVNADFEDLDALNQFCRSADLTRRIIGDSTPVHFSARGDSLVLDSEIMVPWNKMGMGGPVQSVEEAKMMLDFFRIHVAMSFEQPIESINVISAEIENQDKHSIETKVMMREFFDNDLHIAAYF